MSDICFQVLSCSFSSSSLTKSSKVYSSAKEAVKDIKDGSKLLVGGEFIPYFCLFISSGAEV